VSPQIKNLTELGTNHNSSFLSFWAPITPTKDSHKEKIVPLNECKRMKVVGATQGPCLTQQLTLNIVFFSFGAPLTHTQGAPKKGI